MSSVRVGDLFLLVVWIVLFNFVYDAEPINKKLQDFLSGSQALTAN